MEREKSGRWVLKSTNGHGKTVYWRAPRPRPRLHRRQRRRLKQEVMDAAMDCDSSPPLRLNEAHIAIQVLQNAVRDSVARELELQRKLQVAEEALRVSQDGARRQMKEQASMSERAVTAAAAPPAEMTVVHLLSGTPGRCEYELKQHQWTKVRLSLSNYCLNVKTRSRLLMYSAVATGSRALNKQLSRTRGLCRNGRPMQNARWINYSHNKL